MPCHIKYFVSCFNKKQMAITGIKSNTLNSKLRMALKSHIKPILQGKAERLRCTNRVCSHFGKWNKDDDYNYHILITNNLHASTKTVITNYLLRWGIEHCFKELKDTFYFDHYQARHINKIDRHWNLVRLSSRRCLSCCVNSHLLDQTKRLSYQNP
ncbi:MAG: transposase [Candidatus Brocadia sp.]|nr:transposase [Candidatus Brocadia sp.]